MASASCARQGSFRTPEVPASAAGRTADRRALAIAFSDLEVVLRSEDLDVMGALERRFYMMRAPASVRTVGELEVRREAGRYVIRGDVGVPVECDSLRDALHGVHRRALRLWMDARADLLWFHAGAAAFCGRAVLFPGSPGSGKSSLVTSLCARGWSYLSDEIAPLNPFSQTVLPFAGTPAVRTDPGQDMPRESLGRWSKKELRLPPGSPCRDPAPLAAVVRLSYRRDARAELSVSSPANAALQLLEQCGNFPSHHEAAVGYVCALVRHVPCYSVSFSDREAAADLVVRELEGRW